MLKKLFQSIQLDNMYPILKKKPHTDFLKASNSTSRTL